MKITLNPLDQLKKRAIRRINFHRVAGVQDLAHDRKRQLARDVAGGAAPSPEFVRAAEIEALAPAELARVILSKPDVLMVAENARRSLIVQIMSATTAAEIEQILTANAIPPHPGDRLQELLP